MRKALIVGGSSGVGLSVCKQLIDKGYHVVIVSRRPPEEKLLKKDNSWSFISMDLSLFNKQVFDQLSEDKEIEILGLCSGFGRISTFENLDYIEIDRMISTNLTSFIKIIYCFWNRLTSKDNFYCFLMSSAAGLVSSPLLSVYASTKAALCNLCESLNIELETKKTKNRILNVAAGAIKGTKFNGKDNNLSIVAPLTKIILDKMFSREQLFIPEYDELFKAVIERYRLDPHEYGLHSYEYKSNSGRLTEKCTLTRGLILFEDINSIDKLLKIIENARKDCSILDAYLCKDSFNIDAEKLKFYIKYLESIYFVDYLIVDNIKGLNKQIKKHNYSKIFLVNSKQSKRKIKIPASSDYNIINVDF